MELRLDRIFCGKDYTIGKLYIDGTYFCDTIEDTVRDLTKEKKIPGRTAIPCGGYRVMITWSPRFNKMMPLLLNVPHFEGIRIHSGNTASDTEGCIIVGENKIKGKVINSRQTYARLMSILNATKEDIHIVIV